TTNFNHYVVESNVKGTYTGTYATTVWDDTAASNPERTLRVAVTLSIKTMAPQSPNSDPAHGAVYHYTGEVTVRPSGKRSITVPVHGTYTLTQFPKDPFTAQIGSLDIYTQGVTNYYNPGRPTASAVNLDNVVGGFRTTVFDFRRPDDYHSSAPN